MTTSITQNYYMMLAPKHGEKIRISQSAERLGLIVACLLELSKNNILQINKNQLKLINELPSELFFLQPLYMVIAKMTKPSLMKVSEYYEINFTKKRYQELEEMVSAWLVAEGKLEKGHVKGFFKVKEAKVVTKGAKEQLLSEIRLALIEGELSEELLALIVLLNNNHLLTTFFSPYEVRKLMQLMKDIKDSTCHTVLKTMIDNIEMMSNLSLLALS